MKGILTDCITGKETEIKLDYQIMHSVFYLIGGPTGYESFRLTSKGTDIKGMCEKGWMACAGTPGTWDKLVIPGKEMKKAIPKHWIELINSIEETLCNLKF